MCPDISCFRCEMTKLRTGHWKRSSRRSTSAPYSTRIHELSSSINRGWRKWTLTIRIDLSIPMLGNIFLWERQWVGCRTLNIVGEHFRARCSDGLIGTVCICQKCRYLLTLPTLHDGHSSTPTDEVNLMRICIDPRLSRKLFIWHY